MGIPPAPLSDAERGAAVTAFDQRYGEMERVLSCLSRNSRERLIAGEESPVVEALVRKIKEWWGIRGPDSSAEISQALMQMEWSPALFDTAPAAESAADEAYDRVAELIERSRALGAPRREVSWSSKVLHWLLPWRIPVFDKFVRDSLGMAEPEDPLAAYRIVAHEVFVAVHGTAGADPAWLGSLEPRSPLRGIDKCLWWLGGGHKGSAYVDPDPWRVVRELGLDPTS